MSRIKTFINAGRLFPKDLNSIQDDYESYFSSWKEVGFYGAYPFGQSVNSGTYFLYQGSPALFGTNPTASPVGGQTVVFYFDPSDYTSGTRTNKLRLSTSCLTNSNASLVDFTVGLYPVSASGGAAGASTITLGSVVPGTTCLFSSPIINSSKIVISSEITAPAAGFYALACVISANITDINSVVTIKSSIQIRQV